MAGDGEILTDGIDDRSRHIKAPQTTLSCPVEMSGRGLHTGAYCRVRILPAGAGEGVRFVRADLAPEVFVPASVHARLEVPRCTALGRLGSTVMTVEHLLSTLLGLGVDNATIHVEGPELPALDGSAALWVEAVDRVGLVELPAARSVRVLERPVWVEDRGRFVAAVPSERLVVSYLFTADRPGITDQYAEFELTPEAYRRDIAPARTVAFLDEVEPLLAQGLGRGGSLDNVVLITPQGPAGELRFPDEVVRHKILDLVGDLALAGHLLARVTAVRAGHDLHARLVRRILQTSRQVEWGS